METEKKTAILGIGRCGVRVVSELSSMPSAAGLNLLALDTDQAALDNCHLPPEKKLLAGFSWRRGRGCGGNPTAGISAVGTERERITAMLKGNNFLFVVGGLGGGTGSAAAGIVNSIAKKLNLPTVFLLTLPFMLEGAGKHNCADRIAREELLPSADAVLLLPNDLLFAVLPNTARLSDGFRLGEIQLAGTVLALSNIFAGRGELAADYADLTGLLRHRKSSCSIGIGCGGAEDGDRCAAALDRMLHAPLLGGTEKIEKADALLLALVGGEDLSLGETRQLLTEAARLANPKAQIIVNACCVPEMKDSLQLSMVTVKFDTSTAVDAPAFRHDAPTAADAVEQPRLFPADDYGCGIMENTIPVLYHGENLDIPAFVRKHLTIDPGK